MGAPIARARLANDEIDNALLWKAARETLLPRRSRRPDVSTAKNDSRREEGVGDSVDLRVQSNA